MRRPTALSATSGLRLATTAMVLLVVLAFDPTNGARSGASASATSYDWLQFGGNPQHTLNNTLETTITMSNVGTLTRLFQVTLPAPSDSTPVYLGGVSTPGGVRDLLFLTTLAGHTLALDAHTGVTVWIRQYPAGTCTFAEGGPCITTAAPAIDPNRQYVYSFGLDGYVHKYQVGDGTEITGNGWPELVTLKGEKASSNLSFATARNGTTYLYATVALGAAEFQGHLVAVNLTDGSQHVFNALCSDQVDVHFVSPPGTPSCPAIEAGIWGRANVLYHPDLDRIFLTTGDAVFDPPNHSWGDTVLALNPDGTGVNGGPLDSYTPVEQATLEATNEDLGSVGPALLPAPLNSPVPHLALQTGKDAMLRLLNLDNLSGQDGPGHLGGEIIPPVPLDQGPNPKYPSAVRSAPAVWVNPADQSTWVFITNPNGLTALQLTLSVTGTLGLQTKWHTGCPCQLPNGTSPLVANGILYVASSRQIEALNPVDGTLRWQDSSVGTIHWSSPLVANGTLYVSDTDGRLTAYAPAGLPPTPTTTATTPTATPSPRPTSTPPTTATPPPPATPTRAAAPTPTPTPTSSPGDRPSPTPVWRIFLPSVLS